MRPLSIGIKWTLRYTAAMMLVVCALAFVYYKLVERQVRGDAVLLLEMQANEIAEAVERHPPDGEAGRELVAYVEQHVESAQQDLRLGIRLVDDRGVPFLERGVFLYREIPVVRTLRRDSRSGPVEVDVGESFPYVVYASALPRGSVEVAVSSRRFLRGIRDLRNSFLEVLPGAFLATGLLGWWLARSSLAPIARMTEATRRIGAAHLHQRIPSSGSGDELDDLAETLNAMMARIEAGVARLRSFSSNAAHQLRTPLSLLRARLEIAASGARDPAVDQELIAEALRDVDRLSAAVRGMLRLADSEGGLRPEQRRPVDLGALLAEVVEFFEPLAAEHGLKLTRTGAPGAVVRGDAQWLNELFSNLLDNAIQYTPAGGAVQVSMEAGPSLAVVSVRDTGPGIAPDRLTSVFERFERGPGAGAGTGVGLGLTVAREIASAHDGRIDVESPLAGGAVFTVRLPLDREPAPAAV